MGIFDGDMLKLLNKFPRFLPLQGSEAGLAYI